MDLFELTYQCGLRPGKIFQIGTPLLPPWHNFNIKYDGGTFDTVIVLDSLTTAPAAVCAVLLADYCRKLTTGGLLLIGLYLATTSSRNSKHFFDRFKYVSNGVLGDKPDNAPGTCYCYSEEALRRHLRRQNVNVHSIIPGRWTGSTISALDFDLVGATVW